MTRRRFVLIAVLGFIALPGTSRSATYVVRPDGLGDYPDIQTAIYAAVDGDQIILSGGTFTGEGNRNLNYLGKAITIRSWNDEPRDCVIDCQRLGRGLVIQNGEGPASVLRGVTVSNGQPTFNGAGVYLHESSPTFAHCIFEGDSASLGGVIYT